MSRNQSVFDARERMGHKPKARRPLPIARFTDVSYLEFQARILDLLKEAGEPMSTRQVGEAMDGREVREVLKLLARQGKVLREDRPNPNSKVRPMHWWRVV